MSPKPPPDELLERYAQAKAALPNGLPNAPSAALHERIIQAAREQINAINVIAPSEDSTDATGQKGLKNLTQLQATGKEAANDGFWHIKFVASLAVMGLSGLLWLQFEHGTPEEQEAANSAKPRASVVTAAQAPAAVPASPAPATESAFSTATAAPAAPAASAVSQQASTSNATAALERKEAKGAQPNEAKVTVTEMASKSPAAPAATAPAGAPTPEADRSRLHDGAALVPSPAPALPHFSQADKALANVPSVKAEPPPPPQSSPDAIQASSETAASPAPAAKAAARAMPAPAAAPRLSSSLRAAPPAMAESPSKLFAAIKERDEAALRQALAQVASPNARNPEGNPALTQAVIQRWLVGVRILLAAGANQEAKNNKGHTAADVAFELGYSDIAELLATSK